MEKNKELQGKFNYTYLDGIYLAINAIVDSYLLLDSPPCIYDKLISIEKTHDFFSEIFRENSFHRVCSSHVYPDRIFEGREEKISQLLTRITQQRDCSVIFISSIPMAAIIGIQYDSIINKVQKTTKIPLIEIPLKSFHGDWLDGYEEVLLAIARKINFKSNLKKKNNVGIIGYFFDRHEGDHTGNIEELKKILKGLGLNLISVWIDGSSFKNLLNIEQAEVILSMPYARKAAKEIAKKTKADIIELNLPFGIQNTKEWISEIAGKLNKKKEAEVFIDKELKSIIPVITQILPRYFLTKRFSIFNDPYLSYSLASSLIELGAEIEHLIILGKPKINQGSVSNKSILKIKPVYEPLYKEVFDLDTLKTDVFIGNSHIFNLFRVKNNKKPFIEFGYPSFYYHCLTTTPFYGFRGFVNFLNRIINRIVY